MKFTIEQTSKIIKQGTQRMINISSKFHEDLIVKKLLGKDLNITITFDDDVKVS